MVDGTIAGIVGKYWNLRYGCPRHSRGGGISMIPRLSTGVVMASPVSVIGLNGRSDVP
jgi:hypothetical protein